MSESRHLIKDKHLRDLLRYVVGGLFATLFLILAIVIFEHLPIGHKFEMFTCGLLQRQLSSVDDDELPVLVVDISKMPGGKIGQATPRDQLESLIEAIVNQHPRAIAIDIDFSPNGKGWILDNDDKFFDFCLQIKRVRGVPIFLGINRSMTEPSDGWLGDAEYEELAAALIAAHSNTTRLPVWLQAKGDPKRLPTLCTALAEAYRGGPLPEPPKWLGWAIETKSERPFVNDRSNKREIVITSALVNYSKLKAIELSTLPMTSPSSIVESGSLFNDKMVIIGDVQDATERYNVIGRDKPVPGVYLHACAAYTLVREPLNELKLWLRISLDLLISCLLIGSVAWFRFRNHKDTTGSTWQTRRTKFIYWTVPVIFVVGFLLVTLLGVMWLDIFLVAFALLMHPSAESRLDSFWEEKKAQTPDATGSMEK